MMKKVLLFAGLLLFVISAQAKEKSYEKGVLLKMESSPCGSTEKGSKTIVGEILGTDGEHMSTEQLLCQEYVLQGERVVYRIRPRDEKHPVLLRIGETAEFRIDKDKLLLRVPEMNDKEHEYFVLSVDSRTDVQDPRAARTASAQPAQ